MVRKRLKRHRGDQDSGGGPLGGPTSDSSLFEAPDRTPGEMPGLFEAPDRSPGQMPGLFELRHRSDRDKADSPDRPARPPAVGLFDKPPRRK
jgi:hypothetical protein